MRKSDGVARLSSGDHDDRITPVGKVIRACRIDELPQLVNILKGELSIVGPRPERPEIAAQYCEEMPEFLSALTGKGWSDRLRADLRQVQHDPLRQAGYGLDVHSTPQHCRGSQDHVCNGEDPVYA